MMLTSDVLPLSGIGRLEQVKSVEGWAIQVHEQLCRKALGTQSVSGLKECVFACRKSSLALRRGKENSVAYHNTSF